jgi:hypothetical protein
MKKTFHKLRDWVFPNKLFLGVALGLLGYVLICDMKTFLLPFATSIGLYLGLHNQVFSKVLHRRNFWLVFAVIFLVTRLLFFAFCVSMRISTGDLNNVFMPQAHGVLQGGVPNVDFSTHYSQYFPYLIAIPVALVNNPYSIVVLFIFFELLVVFLMFKIGTRMTTVTDVKRSILIYLLSPMSYYLIVYWNQQEVIAAFFLLAVLYAYITLKGQPTLHQIIVPFVMAIAFAFNYLLVAVGLLSVIMLFYDNRVKRKIIIVFSGGLLVLYCPFIFLGATRQVVSGILVEFQYRSVGNNPFVILEVLFGKIPYVSFVLLAIVFLIIYYFIAKNKKTKQYETENDLVVFLPLMLYLVYMTFSKKSFSFYTLLFLPLLSMYVSREREFITSFVVYGLTNSIQYTLLSVFQYQHVYPFESAKTIMKLLLFVLVVGTNIAIQLSLAYNLLMQTYDGEKIELNIRSFFRFYLKEATTFFRCY